MSVVQDGLYKFIIAYVEQNGFQPSYQDMADHFGISKQAITKTLGRLAKDGRIAYRVKGRRTQDRSLILPGVSFRRV